MDQNAQEIQFLTNQVSRQKQSLADTTRDSQRVDGRISQLATEFRKKLGELKKIQDEVPASDAEPQAADTTCTFVKEDAAIFAPGSKKLEVLAKCQLLLNLVGRSQIPQNETAVIGQEIKESLRVGDLPEKKEIQAITERGMTAGDVITVIVGMVLYSGYNILLAPLAELLTQRIRASYTNPP